MELCGYLHDVSEMYVLKKKNTIRKLTWNDMFLVLDKLYSYSAQEPT